MRAGKTTVSFRLNGEERSVLAYPMSRLLDVLREDFTLTGSKEGCGEGECGACSVLIDGSLVNSCLVPIIQVSGRHVLTIEGVADDPEFAELKTSFHEHGAAQCGICTPGMFIAAIELLERKARPSEADVREAISGNICRCTGYAKIIDAVLSVGERRRR